MFMLLPIKACISLDMMLTTWGQIEESQEDAWKKISFVYNNYESGIVSTCFPCPLLLNRVKNKLTILSQNLVYLTL